jgi:DNA-binding transcriptional LysR family regulator
MRRHLPPLEQIEAFIQAARAPSFRVAAERCALSPAAFSRRIQAFSEGFGLTLFTRTSQGVRLTAAGERCLAELEPAYAELQRAADAVFEGDGGPATVCLSLSHSLSVGWLIPRLESFHSAYPDIELVLKAERGADEVRRGAADLAICSSEVSLDGLPSELLLPVTMAPVAAPDVAAQFGAEGRRLGRHRLLAYSQPVGLWNWWANEAAYPDIPAPSFRFEIQQALYEAAANGLGVALGIGPTVAPYLASSRLVRLDLPPARYPGGYRLVTSPRRRRRPAVTKLRRWLFAQAQNTPELA